MAVRRMEKLVDRLATRRGFVALLVLELLFQGAFALLMGRSESGTRPLDLRFYYSPIEADAIIGGFTAADRKAYVVTALTLDMAYPAVYSLLMAVTLALLIRYVHRDQRGWMKLRLLPFAAAGADVLENLAAALLAARYPVQMPAVARAAGVLTAAKWSLVAVCSIMIVAFAACALVVWIKNPRHPRPR